MIKSKTEISTLNSGIPFLYRTSEKRDSFRIAKKIDQAGVAFNDLTSTNTDEGNCFFSSMAFLYRTGVEGFEVTLKTGLLKHPEVGDIYHAWLETTPPLSSKIYVINVANLDKKQPLKIFSLTHYKKINDFEHYIQSLTFKELKDYVITNHNSDVDLIEITKELLEPTLSELREYTNQTK